MDELRQVRDELRDFLDDPSRKIKSRTPKGLREYKRSSFFSNVRHCQMIQWYYRDSQGNLHSGVAKHESEAKKAAEKASGEKI